MLTSEQYRCPNEKRNFSAEFKSKSAQHVFDQNYTIAEATKAMDNRWMQLILTTADLG